MTVYRSIGFLILTMSLACQRLHNRVDDDVLVCGSDVSSFPGAGLVLPTLSEPELPFDWDAIAETASGYRALPRSSRGCLIIPPDAVNSVYFRSGALGASLNPESIEKIGIHKLELQASVEGLSSQTINLSCNSGARNDFSMLFQMQTQPSSTLRRYQLHYELHSTGNESFMLHAGRQLISEGNRPGIELPRILADGEYRLRYRLVDVFEQILAAVEPKTVDCSLHLDTSSPTIGGFAEDLKLLESGDQKIWEVAPGQPINLLVSDASSSRVYGCLYESGSKPCEDFSEINGSLYAPENGSWVIRTYAEDEAGNHSPHEDLATIAVMHRETMKNIDNLLSVARLESQRGQIIPANLKLLDAYQAFYDLKLPMEREPLRQKLGLTFSEVGRSQRLFMERRDHSQNIVKMELLDADLAYSALDSEGHLIVRSPEGPLLLQANDVADFFPSISSGLIIVFKDGTFQRGIGGSREKLFDAPLPVQVLALSQDESRLFVSGPQGSALYQLDASGKRLWSQPSVGLNIHTAAISTVGQEIVIAESHKVVSLDSSTGAIRAEQTWDERCSLVKLQDAGPHGWFLPLKTNSSDAREEFHCELQAWDGHSALRRVDPVQVLRPDPIHEPARYRFEEIETMTYSAEKQWLAFGRNLDASYVLFDLRLQQAAVFEPSSNDGQVDAMTFSKDGRFFAVSHANLRALNLWKLKGPSVEMFEYAEPTLSISAVPHKPKVIQIDPQRSWLITADDTRQVRGYNIEKTLLPHFQSEFASSFRPQARPEIIREFQGRIELLDPYGKLLRSLPKPSPDLFAIERTPDLGFQALDNAGILWVYGPGEEWRKAFESGISPAVFLPSPSGRYSLLSGRDSSGAPQSMILEQVTSGWQLKFKLPFDTRVAAWNQQETHISLLSRQESSLWSLDGRKVASLPGSAVNNYPHLPFSADGMRWLARTGQSLLIWDVHEEKALGPPIVWPSKPAFVSFVENRSDRLWIAASSGGRTQSLKEVDLSGTVVHDFGVFVGGLLHIFREGQEVWAFDSDGRVLRLRDARQGSEILVDIKEAGGEGLLALNAEADLLVTRPASSRIGALFTSEDERQLGLLCRWLDGQLSGETNPENDYRRSACLRLSPQNL